MDKIIFKYAYPLDQERRLLFKQKGWNNYPDIKTVKEYQEKFKGWWSELSTGNNILETISDITKTDLFYPKEVYVIGGGLQAMSTPLIIPIINSKGQFNSKKWFIDTIIHELIHNFISNDNEFPWLKEQINFLRKRYSKESIKTQNHIMVYAVMKKLLKMLNIPETFSLKSLEKWPDYYRALELVEREGYEKIILEYQSFYKNE